MTPPIRSEMPLYLSAIACWLITVLLGSAFTSIAATRFFLGVFDVNAMVRAVMLCTMASMVFSAPALFILPFGVSWALAGPSRSHRTMRLALLIGGLFGLTIFLSIVFVTDAALLKSGVLWFAGCYLPAALLAAAGIYRRWLFRA